MRLWISLFLVMALTACGTASSDDAPEIVVGVTFMPTSEASSLPPTDEPRSVVSGTIPTLAPSDNTAPIRSWIASDERLNNRSIEVGCGTFIHPILTSQDATANIVDNIEAALTSLLTASIAPPFRNNWQGRGLTLGDVMASDGGLVTITIDGQLLLEGACADAEFRAQLLMTIFDNADVNTIRVTVGGQNLAQLLDASGRSGSDAVFSRDELGFPLSNGN